MNSFQSASSHGSPNAATAALPDWLKLTTRYVNELEYGQVILTIHQGNVLEVQKTERTRLTQPKRG